MAHVRVKRIYEEPSAEDGVRLPVDRLWPRGLSRDEARLDGWPRALAPSDALRRWYDHDPARRAVVGRRYRQELARNPDADAEVASLRARFDLRRRFTLLTATKEVETSHAAILRDYLDEKL